MARDRTQPTKASRRWGEYDPIDQCYYGATALVLYVDPSSEWPNGWWEIHPYGLTSRGLERGCLGPFLSSQAACWWWDSLVTRGRGDR